MARPELANRKITISYDGVPTTIQQRNSQKYPTRRPEIFVIADTRADQWSEVFDVNPK